MKLLVVDDEKLIREVIRTYAENDGYEIIEAENGEDALKVLEEESVDLMILDIMMPKMDGYSVLREVKSHDVPVIMLSARSEEFDKLMGFDLGIDDYMTKPFSPKELMARVKSVLKRVQKSLDDVFVYEDLEVNFKAHTVTIDKQEVKVTPKEFELLTYFIENKGIALSREQLLNNLWGYDFYGDDRTIDTHIKMLRNNLGKYRKLIITVHGMGYKFEIKE